MARRASEVLTEREAEIMSALWELGEASSDQIRERLAGDPHDSTVRTLLRILGSKGYVRTRSKLRPTIYLPAIPRSRAQGNATLGLLERFFAGSAEALVLRLLEDEKLTPGQLEQLKQSYSRGQRKRGKS